MELDRACPKEGSARGLCCSPWMDTRREKEKRPPKNNLVKNGGGGEKQLVLAGAHGTWHAVQPQISNNERRMFRALCASCHREN